MRLRADHARREGAAAPDPSLLAEVRARLSALLERLQQRPSLMLFAAGVAAQAFTLAISTLLTRLYTPESFGTLGLIQALVMIGVPLASGRYELALMRGPSHAQARVLIRLCLLMILIATAWASLLTYFLAHASLGRLRLLREAWAVVPAGLLCMAVYDVLAIEASRRGELKLLASSKLAQAGAGGTAQLMFGWLQAGVLGLALGFVVSQAAGALRLAFALVPVGRAPARRRAAGWAEMWAAALRHRRYPLHMSWSSALDGAAKWGLPLLVPLLWDPAVGGFIFLSERIIHRPLQTVSTSLLPVYVAQATQALQAEPARVRGLYFATLRRQVPITAAWTAFVFCASPYLVEPIFGAGWGGAVPIMQTMSLALAPMTTLHCVWHTLQIAGRTGAESVFTTARVLGTVAVVLSCRWLGTTAPTMLAVYAAMQTVFAAGLYLAHQAALRATAA